MLTLTPDLQFNVVGVGLLGPTLNFNFGHSGRGLSGRARGSPFPRFLSVFPVSRFFGPLVGVFGPGLCEIWESALATGLRAVSLLHPFSADHTDLAW
jgi:hypothetical protein